jgi:phosphodiesterase/alkaline phosphatase D-like protein
VTHESAVLWALTEPAGDAGGEPLEVASQPVDAPGAGREAAAPLLTSAARGGTGTALVPLRGGAGRLHRLALRTAAGRTLARWTLRSAPAPARDGAVAFAFGSCFRVDWRPGASTPWRLLEVLGRTRHVDHLLLLGDQIYADETRLLSGRTAAKACLALQPEAPLAARVAPFREAYALSWEDAAAQGAMRDLPTTLAWDDHEISNGWGSLPWHHAPRGRALLEAAAAAFDEMQGARNPPPLVAGSRAHALVRGPASFLTLDLRTHRDGSTGTVLGEAQRRAVQEYVAGPARERALLFVACSVPPVHLPVVRLGLSRHADVADQWSTDANREERRWLLGLLRDYEEGGVRRAVLLGGDVHAATAATLTDPRGRATWQLTSSPLWQGLPWYVRPLLAVAGDAFTVKAGEQRLQGRILRRWHGTNVGVVRGHVRDGRSRLAFEVFRPGRRTDIVEIG